MFRNFLMLVSSTFMFGYVQVASAKDYTVGIDAIGQTVAGQPVTFGMVFGENEIPYDGSLTASIKVGGSAVSLPVQIDKKSSYCSSSSLEFKSKSSCAAADRSMRHVIVSAVIPSALSAGERAELTLSSSNSASASGSNIQFPSQLDAVTKVTIGSKTFVADIASLSSAELNGSLPVAGSGGSKVSEWLAGPIAREWIVRVPFVEENNSSNAHEHLVARYHIRHFPGANNTKVDVIVENNWAFKPNVQSYKYDAQIFINNKLRYDEKGLTHVDHSRWKLSLWESEYPEIQVIHDPAQLMASKAVPNYAPELIGNLGSKIRQKYDDLWAEAKPTVTDGQIVFTDKTTYCMKSENSSYTTKCTTEGQFPITMNTVGPMGIGKLPTRAMPSTGGRPDIGPLPQWTVAYLLDQRYSQYKMMMAVADGAGSWPIHIRDDNTDLPISIQDHPTAKYDNVPSRANVIVPCSSDLPCRKPYKPDSAHQPSLVFVPYLISGDYYYLEELQFWATFNAVGKTAGPRGGDRGMFEGDSQTREQGWSFRTLAQAAFITPDENSLKEYFLHMLKSNIDEYTDIYAADPSRSNSFGVITPRNFPNISPWMQDYLAWSVGYAQGMGYKSATKFAKWKSKFAIQRMGFQGSNFCWIFGANYHLWAGPHPEDRPESVNADTGTVMVQHRKSVGTKEKEYYVGIDDVWKHSNTATNGGYPMTFGGVFSTTAACGSAAQAAEQKLDVGQMEAGSSNTGLTAQMGPALAVAADLDAEDGNLAWNRYDGRTKKPSYVNAPRWAIVPRFFANSGGATVLPVNGYSPNAPDNSNSETETSTENTTETSNENTTETSNEPLGECPAVPDK